jgi:hypothetical protein
MKYTDENDKDLVYQRTKPTRCDVSQFVPRLGVSRLGDAVVKARRRIPEDVVV